MNLDLVSDFLRQLLDKLPAEAKSAQSDLRVPRIESEQYWDARSTIALIIGLCCTGLNPVQEEFVRNHSLRKAQMRKEEGDWKLVAELCLLEPWSPYYLISWLNFKVGPYALFGNWINLIAHKRKILKWKNPYLPKLRRPKPVQRKRGYTDKGSLGSIVRPTAEREPLTELQVQVEHTLFWENIPTGASNNRFDDSQIRARQHFLAPESYTQEEHEEVEKELLKTSTEEKEVLQEEEFDFDSILEIATIEEEPEPAKYNPRFKNYQDFPSSSRAAQIAFLRLEAEEDF